MDSRRFGTLVLSCIAIVVAYAAGHYGDTAPAWLNAAALGAGGALGAVILAE